MRFDRKKRFIHLVLSFVIALTFFLFLGSCKQKNQESEFCHLISKIEQNDIPSFVSNANILIQKDSISFIFPVVALFNSLVKYDSYMVSQNEEKKLQKWKRKARDYQFKNESTLTPIYNLLEGIRLFNSSEYDDFESFVYSYSNNLQNNKYSELEIYTFLKLLLYLIDRNNDNERYNLALDQANFGLHLILTKKLQTKYPNLLADFFFQKGSTLNKNTSNQDRSNLVLEWQKSKSIYDNINMQSKANDIQTNINQALASKNNIEIDNNNFNGQITQTASAYLAQGFTAEENNNFILARTKYDEGLQLLEDVECSDLKSKLLIYKGFTFLDDKKAIYAYLNTYEDMILCDDISIEIKNYYYQLLWEYQKETSNSLISIDSTIKVLKTQREYLKIVHKYTESSHLDDAYAENTVNILDIIESKYNSNEIPKNYQHLILKLLVDTKARKLKEAILFSRKAHSKHLSKSLALYNEREKLDKTNYYKSKIHEFIWNEKMKLQSAFKDPTNNTDSILLDPSTLYQQDILEIIQYDDQIFICYLINGLFSIQKLPKDQLKLSLEKVAAHIDVKESIPENLCYELESFFNFPDMKDNSIIHIVPDGIFAQFPFSILPKFDNKNIYYYFNTSQINNNIETELNKEKVSVYSYSDTETIYSDDQYLEEKELPNAFKEAKYIHDSIFPSSNLFSGRKFIASAIAKSDIAHFATHAFSDTGNIYNTAIIIRDLYYNPTPYYGYDLLSTESAKFVFLNACESGYGAQLVGQGTFSYSRYCFQSGAKSVLKTLWKVDDQSSAFFSKSFYKNWITGISAGEAFHLAQQQTKAEFSEPYHWAPFVLEGNPNLYLSQN